MTAGSLLPRTMATLTRQMQPITRTAEGAVAISYSTLISSPLSLGNAIGMPSSLTLIFHL